VSFNELQRKKPLQLGAVQPKFMFFRISVDSPPNFNQKSTKRAKNLPTVLKISTKSSQKSSPNQSINQLVLQCQKFRQIFMFLSLYKAPSRHCELTISSAGIYKALEASSNGDISELS
jgi:hypothetical protein